MKKGTIMLAMAFLLSVANAGTSSGRLAAGCSGMVVSKGGWQLPCLFPGTD